MTVEETYETIFSRDASRLDVLHHIKVSHQQSYLSIHMNDMMLCSPQFEQDLRGVDKRQIPFKVNPFLPQ